MEKTPVSLSRLAARLVFMVPLVALTVLGCDSGNSDSPANKSASQEHATETTKNMENFMKNKPAESRMKRKPCRRRK